MEYEVSKSNVSQLSFLFKLLDNFYELAHSAHSIIAFLQISIPMFEGGTEVKCWLVAEFYKSLNIRANTVACESARALNYICGCSDTSGYGGAVTDSKMKALVWFPRIGAILSILVRNRHDII